MAERFNGNKRNKQKSKKIFILIGIALIIIGIIISIKFFYKDEGKEYKQEEQEISNNENPSNELIEEQLPETEEKIENKEDKQPKEITQIGGYKVIGKIKIDKINLEDVILEKTTNKSLDLGLTKFWGPEMNEVGNFSITGHNYKISRSALFSKLNNLVEGDTFTLQDLKNRTVKYKIYKKYTVKPDDTTPIDQNKDGKREVTLITCTKGAKDRIIFKAREI